MTSVSDAALRRFVTLLALIAAFWMSAGPAEGTVKTPQEFTGRPARNVADGHFLLHWSPIEFDPGQYAFVVRIANRKDGHYRTCATIRVGDETFPKVAKSLPYRFKAPEGYFCVVERRAAIQPYWAQVELDFKRSIAECWDLLGKEYLWSKSLGQLLKKRRIQRRRSKSYMDRLHEKLSRRREARWRVLADIRAAIKNAKGLSILDLERICRQRMLQSKEGEKEKWDSWVKSLAPLVRTAEKIVEVRKNTNELEAKVLNMARSVMFNLAEFETKTAILAAEGEALFRVHAGISAEELLDAQRRAELEAGWQERAAQLERKKADLSPDELYEFDRLRFLKSASNRLVQIYAVRGSVSVIEQEAIDRAAWICLSGAMSFKELKLEAPGRAKAPLPQLYAALVDAQRRIQDVKREMDMRPVSERLGSPKRSLQTAAADYKTAVVARILRKFESKFVDTPAGPGSLRELRLEIARLKTLFRAAEAIGDDVQLDFDKRRYFFQIGYRHLDNLPLQAYSSAAAAFSGSAWSPCMGLNSAVVTAAEAGEKGFIDSGLSASITGRTNWFDSSYSAALVFAVLFTVAVVFSIFRARRHPNLFIRKIAGLEAVDEAIGRGTEMGRPVLFVHGLSGVGDIAVLASLNILGRVARQIATYDSRVIVANSDPIVYSISQEVVREGCMEAGRPDVYNPDDIFICATSQFPFVAAVAGIMSREKPAANLFMGYFYAEALILAEAGASTGAIQIAGTDAFTQLPFFVTTCDYTLMGEELYAASAYLSREPKLLGTLKAQDIGKVFVAALIILGAILTFLESSGVVNFISVILKDYR